MSEDNSVDEGGSDPVATTIFFTELEDDALHQSYVLTQNATITIPNNGRPDFGLNPFAGPKPTLEQIQAAAPAKAWEGRFGATSGPWTTQQFVAAVYQSLLKEK